MKRHYTIPFFSRWLDLSSHTFLLCCKWWNWHKFFPQIYHTDHFSKKCQNSHIIWINTITIIRKKGYWVGWSFVLFPGTIFSRENTSKMLWFIKIILVASIHVCTNTKEYIAYIVGHSNDSIGWFYVYM